MARKEVSSVELAGKLLTCAHCGEKRFWTRHAQLNTAVLSFFDLDFLNRTADVYVCDRCGHVEWFLPPK